MNIASTTLDALRDSATHNIALKISALGIAVLMFSLVRGAEDLHSSIYVDVVIQPPPGSENMILMSEIPDRVRLRIKGSRSRLNALRPEHLPAVEVRPRSIEEEHFYFEDEQFDLPAGVEVTEVMPSSIDVRWATRSSKWVRVELATTGRLNDELTWQLEPSVKPDVVMVEGPSEIVGALGRVRTVDVDLSALSADGTSQRDVRLVGPPANTKYNVQVVSVTWHARVKMIERELDAIPIEISGENIKSVRPGKVVVRVRGPVEAVERLSAGELSATFDETDAPGHGVLELPVVVRGLPPRVELVEVQPKAVTVVMKDGSD